VLRAIMRGWVMVLFLLGSLSVAADIPQVSADVGPCTAAFTVTDAAQKPLYDAKIKTIVRHGFMSKRKVELEIGTDANGKARFTGLPHEVKKPIEFSVRYKDVMKTITHDPATNCHANFDVALGTKP
jgi:hypothetical protein